MSDTILIDALFANNIRVAHVRNGGLENFNFEVAGNKNVRGNIYLGKVLRVENSLQAAFVDYGGEKNGFLSISEIHPDYFHLPLEEKQKLIKTIEDLQDDKNGEGKELPTKELNAIYRSYNISSIVKVGQLVLVQGVKEERGNKGATLTSYVSLAGRYCVYMANTPNRNGISRKIHNIGERQRIRDIIADVHNTGNGSVVVRTAGEGIAKDGIAKDYNYLAKIWDDIKKKTLSAQAPEVIHQDGSIIKNVIREYCTSDTQEIIIDGKAAFSNAEEILQNPAYKNLKLIKHTSRTPLFVAHKIEEKISDLINPTVNLESGASLVIQQTEALISIDVNSGKSTGEISIEETAIKTNKEATREIARQLRLRNLSGLIVIDFIDMHQYSNRRAIEKEFKMALEQDRARVQILSISNFGLMEVSRQRTSPTILETAGNICPHCNGGGFIQSVEHSSMSLLRQVISFIHKSHKQIKKLQVETRAETSMHILNYKLSILREIEDEGNVKIIFVPSQQGCKITDITKSNNDDAIFIAEKDWNAEEYSKPEKKKLNPTHKSKPKHHNIKKTKIGLMGKIKRVFTKSGTTNKVKK
ncbi:MAG: ribonuclease E [Candidatus Deianiraeaceae bacterium]|jgi:ribonuclease E